MSRNLYFEDELTREKFNGFMLKRLIQYAGAYKLTYIKVIFMLIGTSFLSLLPTAINAYIIENILPQNGVVPENILVKSVIMLSLWMTLSIGGVVSGYITAKISSKLGNAIVCNLREDLFQKLMELSFDYYDNRPTGKILVRITNYTDEIAGFFINDMTRIVENIFTMVIAIIAIIVIEPRMGLVTIIVSMPLGLLMWWVAKKLHERVRNDRNKSSNRTAFVAEAINGLEVIKAFNREELNDEIFIELSDKYHKAFMQSTRYREIFFPLSHGIIRIMCTVILYATALFIATNNIGAGITLGALVTITTYMQRFSSSVFTI